MTFPRHLPLQLYSKLDIKKFMDMSEKVQTDFWNRQIKQFQLHMFYPDNH